MTNSRQKGKVGERQAAAYLRSLGFTSAHRGVQYQGGTDSPDIVCDELPGVHIEVKFGVKGMDLGTKLLDAAIEQSIREQGRHQRWCVLWKPLRAQQWRLTCYDTRAFICTYHDDGAIQRVLHRLNQVSERLVTCYEKEAA